MRVNLAITPEYLIEQFKLSAHKALMMTVTPPRDTTIVHVVYGQAQSLYLLLRGAINAEDLPPAVNARWIELVTAYGVFRDRNAVESVKKQ